MIYQLPQNLLQNYWQQTMVEPPRPGGTTNAFGAGRQPKGAISPAMPQATMPQGNAFAHPGAFFGQRRKRKLGAPVTPQQPGGF